jgi:hypothetical protein
VNTDPKLTRAELDAEIQRAARKIGCMLIIIIIVGVPLMIWLVSYVKAHWTP